MSSYSRKKNSYILPRDYGEKEAKQLFRLEDQANRSMKTYFSVHCFDPLSLPVAIQESKLTM